MAEAAVAAEYAKRARGEYKLSFTVQGSPNLTAEANLTMDDTFRDGIAGDWIVTKVRSRLLANGGYTCEIEAEKPNDDPDVAADEDSSETDQMAPSND